ncbi:MAG: DUF434 domain-containing protein [Bacteroidota bacterium]|nr:DUF434 domain-containing protein [Bacteroidota bacterium]
MELSSQFNEAAVDYLYLLEKKYPQKAIIKLIGDRYTLPGKERTILYRGLTTNGNKKFRANRLLSETDLINQDIHIDAYNVLITIGSYLNGSLVFVANDNYLRDASEIHGKVFRTSLFDRGILMIIDFLNSLNVCSVHFYFDKPVSKSGIISSKVNKILSDQGIEGDSRTVDSPDYVLKHLENGVVCSSDSTIIDNTPGNLFDLARQTLIFHFKPDFLNLYNIY